MEPGELLTRWTVRVALLGYVLALALCIRGQALPAARLAWTAGYLAFLIHVVCAFQYYHHWSHLDAYETTAQRTAQVAGFAWGGGLYLNYLFALLWGGDVLWWWLDPSGYSTRSRLIEWILQGFLAFIALNATLVFGVGTIRWLGLTGCLVLVGAALFRPKKQADR
jgi:hypothetical protein